MIGFAVRIVLRTRISIDDVGIVVRVGDDVRIAIKVQERRERLTRSTMFRRSITRLSGVK